MKKKDPNRYPPGLRAKKVREIIAYYDRQPDEEAAREIESAQAVEPATWIAIPRKLLPKVQKLLADYRKSA